MQTAKQITLAESNISEVDLVKQIFTHPDILSSMLSEAKLSISDLDETTICLEEKGEFTKRADATFVLGGNKFIFECMSSKGYLDEDHIARALLYCIRTNSNDLIILCEDIRDNVERLILENFKNYNIRLSLIKYKMFDNDTISFTRIISPKEYLDNFKVEKKKFVTDDLTVIFSGLLPMSVSGSRTSNVSGQSVTYALTGTINVDGTITVNQTDKKYESLSAACMDGLKHVSSGQDITISGWRFWRDNQDELLYKYKEILSSPTVNKDEPK